MNAGAFVAGFLHEWLDPRKRAERKQRRKESRERRKAAKRGEPLTEQELQILNTTEEVTVLEGKKTFLGLAGVVIGLVLQLLGIGQCAPEAVDCVAANTIAANITAAIDQLLIAGGALYAIYGKLDAARRERKLKAELEAAQTKP